MFIYPSHSSVNFNKLVLNCFSCWFVGLQQTLCRRKANQIPSLPGVAHWHWLETRTSTCSNGRISYWTDSLQGWWWVKLWNVSCRETLFLYPFYLFRLKTPGLKSNCLICCNSTDATASVPTKKVSKNHKMERWMEDCANSICEELSLDQESSVCLKRAAYCSDCYQLVCDVDFLHRTIRCMKQKLQETVTEVENRLVRNFKLGLEVKEAAGNFIQTPYSMALNHIGAQLERKQNVMEDMYFIFLHHIRLWLIFAKGPLFRFRANCRGEIPQETLEAVPTIPLITKAADESLKSDFPPAKFRKILPKPQVKFNLNLCKKNKTSNSYK